MKTRRLGYNGVLTCLNMRACIVIQDLRVFFIMFSLMRSGFFTHKPERYYLLPDEDEPYHTCKSKNNIPKLMFLCVTFHPRFENGVCTFDGKIGVCTFDGNLPHTPHSPHALRPHVSLPHELPPHTLPPRAPPPHMLLPHSPHAAILGC
jgi:hypothetical protein